MADLRMTLEERDAFLAEPHIAVVAVPADGMAPVMTPVWYRYEPGGCVYFTSLATGKKASRLKSGTPIALNVQAGDGWAAGYVTVEGIVERISSGDERAELRRMDERYFGADADNYMAVVPPDYVWIEVCVRPTRFFSRDYTKLGLATRS